MQSTNEGLLVFEDRRIEYAPTTTMELFLRQQAAYREIRRGLRRAEELPYCEQEEETLP